MKSKIKAGGIATICIALVIVICIGTIVIPSLSYAQTGSMVKQGILDILTSDERTEDEETRYEEELKEKSFAFIAPTAFTNSSPVKSSLTERVFLTDINPHEMAVEWKNMSVAERVDASEIPSDLIQKLSTDEIIMYNMNYNFICDMYLSNNMQIGFEQLREQYNGIDTILSRSDSSKRLIQLYKSIDLNELYKNDRYSSMRMNYIEMLLAQDEILTSLTEDEAHELVIACFAKAIQMYNMESGRFGISTTLYLGLRCLYEHDPYVKKIIDGNKGLTAFISSSLLDFNNIDNITIGKLVVHFQKNYLEGDAQ